MFIKKILKTFIVQINAIKSYLFLLIKFEVVPL